MGYKSVVVTENRSNAEEICTIGNACTLWYCNLHMCAFAFPFNTCITIVEKLLSIKTSFLIYFSTCRNENYSVLMSDLYLSRSSVPSGIIYPMLRMDLVLLCLMAISGYTCSEVQGKCSCYLTLHIVIRF